MKLTLYNIFKVQTVFTSNIIPSKRAGPSKINEKLLAKKLILMRLFSVTSPSQGKIKRKKNRLLPNLCHLMC